MVGSTRSKIPPFIHKTVNQCGYIMLAVNVIVTLFSYHASKRQILGTLMEPVCWVFVLVLFLPALLKKSRYCAKYHKPAFWAGLTAVIPMYGLAVTVLWSSEHIANKGLQLAVTIISFLVSVLVVFTAIPFYWWLVKHTYEFDGELTSSRD